MRVNFGQKLIIMLRVVGISVRDSLRVMLGAFFLRDKCSYNDRVIHCWARGILRTLQVKYKIFNPYNLEFDPGRPYIIMSNHLSHFDIPLIYVTFPQDSVGMIAKKELFRIPIFGWGMKLCGWCFSIDRKNMRQAVLDLKVIKRAMLNGVRMWMAPEGTRSRTGKMGPFKKGGFKIAADTKAIIIPVTIIGSDRILPAKTFDFSTNEEVAIYIGEPIDTLHYSAEDPSRLMTDTANEIKKKFK